MTKLRAALAVLLIALPLLIGASPAGATSNVWECPTSYREGMSCSNTSRVRYVVQGIQTELYRGGFLTVPPPYNGAWGPATTTALRAWQTYLQGQGLGYLTPPVDGNFDKYDSMVMFGGVEDYIAVGLGIPNNLFWGLVDVESQLDPGAYNSGDTDSQTCRDRGIVEWNSCAHPEISDATAWGDPDQSMLLAAQQMKNQLTNSRNRGEPEAQAEDESVVQHWCPACAAYHQTHSTRWWPDDVDPDGTHHPSQLQIGATIYLNSVHSVITHFPIP